MKKSTTELLVSIGSAAAGYVVYQVAKKICRVNEISKHVANTGSIRNIYLNDNLTLHDGILMVGNWNEYFAFKVTDSVFQKFKNPDNKILVLEECVHATTAQSYETGMPHYVGLSEKAELQILVCNTGKVIVQICGTFSTVGGPHLGPSNIIESRTFICGSECELRSHLDKLAFAVSCNK